MDMTPTIVPKSDQLNADDLLCGPVTIKITSVTIRPGTEQPVSMFYDGDNGKPWKPCKSMSRVLVAAWGPDASKYKGRSLTLYCDPKVKWGGMEVGGIRISHMSDIDSSITMALTVTRANKKPFTVKPLVTGAPKAAATHPATDSPATTGDRSAVEPGSAAAPAGSGDHFITPDQAIQLEDLCKETKTKVAGLLNVVGAKVNTLALLPPELYEPALDFLAKRQAA